MLRPTRKRKYKGSFIDDIYDEDSQLVQEQKLLKQDIESMKDELRMYNEKERDYKKQSNMLASLYEEGIIDADGNLNLRVKTSIITHNKTFTTLCYVDN